MGCSRFLSIRMSISASPRMARISLSDMCKSRANLRARLTVTHFKFPWSVHPTPTVEGGPSFFSIGQRPAGKWATGGSIDAIGDPFKAIARVMEMCFVAE
jgi:hypothetical protein